jgi:hypothetical protein
MSEGKELAFSRSVVVLMKAHVTRDRDPETWDTILEQRFQIYDYVEKLGLELVIDETDGYAYLKQRNYEVGENEIPRLIPRHQLSYPVSLLLVLLRKRLLEFDSDVTGDRLILTKEQIIDLMKVYLKDSVNEAKVIGDIGRHIDRLREMGFLRRIPVKDNTEERYEVQRIIRGIVNGEWLSDFDEKLERYIKAGEGADPDED